MPGRDREETERDREPDWRWSSGQDRPGKGKGIWRRKKKRRQRINPKIFAKKEKISRMFGLNILQQGRGEERNRRQRQRQVKLDSFLVGTLAKCLHCTGLDRPDWKWARQEEKSHQEPRQREKGLGWGVESLQTGPEGEGPQPQETPRLEQREAP